MHRGNPVSSVYWARRVMQVQRLELPVTVWKYPVPALSRTEFPTKCTFYWQRKECISNGPRHSPPVNDDSPLCTAAMALRRSLRTSVHATRSAAHSLTTRAGRSPRPCPTASTVPGVCQIKASVNTVYFPLNTCLRGEYPMTLEDEEQTRADFLLKEYQLCGEVRCCSAHLFFSDGGHF